MEWDTKPDPEEIMLWFRRAPVEHQRFFAQKSPLAIPFCYYGYPGPFADAAMANDEVQENIRLHPEVWTEQSIRRTPPLRWEFEYVLAWGGLEVMRWASGKSGWGSVKWVAPILPEDPIHPMYLECIHKPNSKFRQGMEQRFWMKKMLGKRHAPLVQKCRRNSKTQFLQWIADAPADYERVLKQRAEGKSGVVLYPPDSEQVIMRRLFMTPGEFWKYARGLPIPPTHPCRQQPVQRLLFTEDL